MLKSDIKNIVSHPSIIFPVTSDFVTGADISGYPENDLNAFPKRITAVQDLYFMAL